LTCYFRHLGPIFAKAGIEVTKENKQKVDQIIHDIVKVEYKSCPSTWKAVKKQLAEDEAGFVLKLKTAWKK
jgi:hypothetical protein